MKNIRFIFSIGISQYIQYLCTEENTDFFTSVKRKRMEKNTPSVQRMNEIQQKKQFALTGHK